MAHPGPLWTLAAYLIKLIYCSSSWARKGYFAIKTLIYVVKAVVHCSISVMTFEGFFETLITEFSSDKVNCSSSVDTFKLVGKSLDSSKNSPV